jgi:hypothetical protein
MGDYLPWFFILGIAVAASLIMIHLHLSKLVDKQMRHHQAMESLLREIRDRLGESG